MYTVQLRLQRCCLTVLQFGIYDKLVRIISPEEIPEGPKFYSKFMVRMGKQTKKNPKTNRTFPEEPQRNGNLPHRQSLGQSQR